MPPGSSLGTHLDSQIHPNRRWLRTHSAVLFLNMGWGKEDGGEFYMMLDADPQKPEIRTFENVLPEFGKLAVFECNESAYHGVDPIRGFQCRITLSVFFWKEARRCNLSLGQLTNLRTKAHFI